jgi:predicted transcriptional regulator
LTPESAHGVMHPCKRHQSLTTGGSSGEQMTVLHVKVAEPMADLLERARDVIESLHADETPEPYFRIGFESLPQLLGVFSLERWDLVTHLRAQGPPALAELAHGLGRDEPQANSDCTRWWKG